MGAGKAAALRPNRGTTCTSYARSRSLTFLARSRRVRARRRRRGLRDPRRTGQLRPHAGAAPRRALPAPALTHGLDDRQAETVARRRSRDRGSHHAVTAGVLDLEHEAPVPDADTHLGVAIIADPAMAHAVGDQFGDDEPGPLKRRLGRALP